jgi:integrase
LLGFLHFLHPHGRRAGASDCDAIKARDNSDPYFRRFMVAAALTGTRPCELRLLRWSEIVWDKAIAVQRTGKTVKKTGRPRIIVLPPPMLKLLAYIRSIHHGPAALELKRILENSPNRQAKIRDVAARMRACGYSYRSVYLARKRIGAEFKRVGGWREHGYTVYFLPENAIEQPAPAADDFVFLNGKHRPWTRQSLCTKFYRLRKLLGLPADCKIYGTRHAFITRRARGWLIPSFGQATMQ